MNLTDIEIHFDGGCRPTNPGNKYGSYEVIFNSLRMNKESERELGYGTNNEAEFEILIAALHWTLWGLAVGGFVPRNYRLKLFTDSTIVANRLVGKNKTRKSEPEQRMFKLAEQCTVIMSQFKESVVKWNRRDANVSRFGH